MGRVNLFKARKQWLRARGLSAAHVDEDVLDAFAAGWNAARPTIEGTGRGATHNSDGRPGRLKVTIWGHTKDGQSMALVYDEAAMAHLVADLERCDVLRRHP